MSDRDHIDDLIALASEKVNLLNIQRRAAKKLLDYDGEIYPHDGCAITLSLMLQDAGIKVKDTYQALALTNILKNDRNWTRVAVGEQKAGDIGTTCGETAKHGEDHIYLVLKPMNQDEMVIADNQDTHPHFRYASGKGGKTPTKYFLRAGG